MKVKMYAIICRAVEEGSMYGVNRAFKHTDTPTREMLADETETAILEALNDVFDFDAAED